VAGYARQHGLRLRPHTKTHKSIRLAKRQLQSGAVGLTVAKVSEARSCWAQAGGPAGSLSHHRPCQTRAADGGARRARVTVALDSVFAARQLSEAARAAQLEIGVLAEVDVGLGAWVSLPAKRWCNWRSPF